MAAFSGPGYQTTGGFPAVSDSRTAATTACTHPARPSDEVPMPALSPTAPARNAPVAAPHHPVISGIEWFCLTLALTKWNPAFSRWNDPISPDQFRFGT